MIRLFFVSLIILLITTPPQAQEAANIVVEIEGLENEEGQVILDVFTSKEGFPLKTARAAKRFKASIQNGKALFEFYLTPGDYAFALFHDENSNNKLEQNFIGIPKEGVGASNNAKGRFGPPKFKDVVFTVGNEEVKMILEIVYI